MSEIRKQVEAQCKAVAHLANALSEVYRDKAQLVQVGGYDHEGMLNDLGQRTAFLMETLGNILNDMDAVDEDADAWLYPVFAAAQRLYPQRHDEAHEGTASNS